MLDIDRYIARHSPSWQRLEALTSRAEGRASNLTADEADELVQLYQRTSAHLAHVRAAHHDQAVINRLSKLLASSRQVIYTKRKSGPNVVGSFVLYQFPGALWTLRWWILRTTALFVAIALASGLFLAAQPDARAAEIPKEAQRAIVASQFEDYYRSDAASSFAAKVQTNNIQVALVCVAGGAALGVLPLAMIANEGMRFGTLAAVMHAGGAGSKFWGLVLPHGLLELFSIFVAAATGMSMGWAFIAPGRRSRGEAFAEAAGRAVSIAGGLFVNFCVAGLIEAFVTPSGLPTFARVSIGVLALAAFLAYALALGPTAVAHGYTGRPAERRNSWERTGDELDERMAMDHLRRAARRTLDTVGTLLPGDAGHRGRTNNEPVA